MTLTDKVDDYAHNNTAKLIYSKNDAEFEANLKQWFADMKAMGADKADEWAIADWNAAMKKVDDIMAKAK